MEWGPFRLGIQGRLEQKLKDVPGRGESVLKRSSREPVLG